MVTWLSDNEKYALIALEVRVNGRNPMTEFAPGYWAWTDVPLEVPPHWREWLGTVQTEAIEHSNLILLCKVSSKTPAVLDAENELLKRRVWSLYIGLLLSSTFTLDRPPILLSGARQGRRVGHPQSDLARVVGLKLDQALCQRERCNGRAGSAVRPPTRATCCIASARGTVALFSRAYSIC